MSANKASHFGATNQRKWRCGLPGEMTTELETSRLAAQKDAMVEDCADAREARDAALLRVEGLEMELGVLETKLERRDEAWYIWLASTCKPLAKPKTR